MARTVTPSRWPEGAARSVFVCLVGSVLASCMTAAGGPADAGRQVTQSAAASPIEPGPTALIDARLRPVPEEFEVEANAVWDGKRTLQGIWVAHPAAETARRVRIVNVDTGFAVDGALFRRDDSSGGPSVLVSSDAAAALGMTADEPATLSIVAIRRGPVTVPVAPESAIAQSGLAEDPADDATAEAAGPDDGTTEDGAETAEATEDAGDAETLASADAGQTPPASAGDEPGGAEPAETLAAAEATEELAEPVDVETAAVAEETAAAAGEAEEPAEAADDTARATWPIATDEADNAETAGQPVLGLAAIDTTGAAPRAPAREIEPEAPAPAPEAGESGESAEPAEPSEPAEADAWPIDTAALAPDAAETATAASAPEPDTAPAPATEAAEPAPSPAPAPAPAAEPALAESADEDDTGRRAALDPDPAAPAAEPEPSPLGRPFIQAGIFGVQSNATRLIAAIEAAGYRAEGKPFRSQGRQMTRVVAGPFQSTAERREALRAIRELGTADAIPVAR